MRHTSSKHSIPPSRLFVKLKGITMKHIPQHLLMDLSFVYVVNAGGSGVTSDGSISSA